MSNGIVCVTTFCNAQNNHYSKYIGYMDRDEATKKEHFEEIDLFSEYVNYMKNFEKTKGWEVPEHISSVFTIDKDNLTDDEVSELKNQMFKGQENGSLMWQTVYSFDNDWLSDMGIYDKKTHSLDEKRLKSGARKGISELLKREGLEDAVWSGAIHYNTDNIHIHIATVEIEPVRKKKLYTQYEKVQIDGRWQYKKVFNPATKTYDKIPILDENGNEYQEWEFVGRFELKNILKSKSVFLSELTDNKEANKKINELIRNRMLNHIKDNPLYYDEDFKSKFLNLYKTLPHNKGMWYYNNKGIKDYRPQIDDLINDYIKKYLKDEFSELENILDEQENIYKKAYGGSNNYKANKLKELNERMGNAVLREMKIYSKNEENKINHYNEKTEYQGEFKENIKKKILKNWSKDYTSKDGKKFKSNRHKKNYKLERELRSGLYHLRKSLNNTVESFLNELDYELLQREINGDYGSTKLGL